MHDIEVSSNNCIPISVKVALSCITCDIPAAENLSHNAAMGCNKCLKSFPVSDRKLVIVDLMKKSGLYDTVLCYN